MQPNSEVPHKNIPGRGVALNIGLKKLDSIPSGSYIEVALELQQIRYIVSGSLHKPLHPRSK